MSRLVISEIAERHLDLWADQVQRGELAIYGLPLAVQQYVSIGWADGIAYARQQAREYEHQLDQLYLAAFSPKDRREIYQRRLDQHFAEQAALFFAEPYIEGPAPSPISESQLNSYQEDQCQQQMRSGQPAQRSLRSETRHARAA